MKKRAFILIFLLIGSTCLMSQVRFYASTDAREILVNSYVQVEFVLENAAGTEFKAPDFGELKVLSGPNQSSQMSIINGRKTQKRGYSYTLVARQAGNYIISSASIKVKGKLLKSDPIKIKVVKGRSASASKDNEKDLFVRAEISDTVAYPGQQLLLRYVLYSRKRVNGYNFLSQPAFEGFYTQEINTRNRLSRQVVDGVEYNVQSLHSLAIFPQQLGDLNIDAVQISLGVVLRDDPFSLFQNTKQIPVITNDIWVRVIPLPDNAPASFQGALGKYQFSSHLSRRAMTTDDATSLTVTIKGNGLSKFIEAPILDLGDQFEVYDPKVLRENTFPTNDDLISEKAFEYLLVPKSPGRKNFSVEFTYFDTDSSRYITLNSDEYFINVSQGENKLSNLSPEELLEKYQLRPLMINQKLYKKGEYFLASNPFWILLFLILSIIPAMLLLKYRLIKKGQIDPDILRKKKAAKESLKRLKPARALLDEGNHQDFYQAISDALNLYISDKFTIDNKDLTSENIRSVLEEKGIGTDLSEAFFSIRQKCDMALYAPGDEKASLSIYEKSDKLLRDLELRMNK